MGLTKQEAGKRVGLTAWMDKLVRRAGSLALATSYTHKLVVRFQTFLRLVASCIQGEVA